MLKLNSWYRTQFKEWCAHPRWSDDECPEAGTHLRGGNALMDYVVPGPEPSIVLGRHLLRCGAPRLPSESLMRELNSSGITRLVCGHTPHGCCPTVVDCGGPPSDAPHLQIVMADMSYSDMKAADNRGEAVAEVQILPDGALRVHGQLHDRRRIAYTLAATRSERRPCSLVGRLVDEWPTDLSVGVLRSTARKWSPCGGFGETWIIKAWLPDTAEYLLCRVAGFTMHYETQPESTVRSWLQHSRSLGGPNGQKEKALVLGPPPLKPQLTASLLECAPRGNRQSQVSCWPWWGR